MSVNIPYILQRKCKDRNGIRITKEYLESFWNQEQPRPLPDTDEAYDQLLQDFLHKDIALTSEPVIPENFGQNTIETFPLGHLRHGGGVVLQIQDTVDICYSALSLLNNLTNATPIRQIYGERNNHEQITFPRGMLRWTLTDGKNQIQAMEVETIPDLSLTTPFGCKILVKSCQVRRGMLLLVKNSIKVLGGDVLELYGGNMLKELENRFKESIRQVSDRAMPEARGPVATQSPLLLNDTIAEDELLDDDDFDDTELERIKVDLVEHSEASFDNGPGFFASIDQISSNNKNDLQQNITSHDDSDLNGSTLISHDDQQQAFLNNTREIGSSPLLSKRNRMMPHSNMRSKKRNSVGTRANTISTAVSSEISPNETIGHQSTQEQVPWVDQSFWDDFSKATSQEKKNEDDGVFVDSQGKVHITFSKLQQTLEAIENNGCVGNLPDVVIVRARCIQFGKLVTSNRLYSLVLFFDDPDQATGNPVQIIFSNDALAKLLDATRQHVVDTNIAGGQKAVLRHIFKPFDKKVRNAIADIEIDLSITQKSDSGFLLPMGIGYVSL
ncbi:hypothetical protein G6F46_001743 [Rhizopus delemar]|uniref:RecQ-mediated genome instability protein 1 n=2 Tax=Rhizopus TaxID=4842 RepID=A0A9P6Z093_9FUNG|nr:hypothetical protein G6F55_007164 [Rhizopus delemar]KAG1541243.1 hypothetical protein G6F51_008017 [Rhizopus arrhizus]KAG1498654.1 hypothetical protein G6F54_004935 [Rhizopus delemar]KAG1508686.1 hypothetical protein G6F53_008009 [Rhizopus delemar]KAG1524283.1 hypothetical protein G6F52_004315 [Rhizopus delemar]